VRQPRPSTRERSVGRRPNERGHDFAMHDHCMRSWNFFLKNNFQLKTFFV